MEILVSILPASLTCKFKVFGVLRYNSASPNTYDMYHTNPNKCSVKKAKDPMLIRV